MKILRISQEGITFDNDIVMTDYHEQDCCENVYADFKHLQDEALVMDAVFPEDLQIEKVEGSGFRIFDVNNNGYFIPCHDKQNGYYSNNLVLYLHKGEELIKSADISDCTLFEEY